MASFIFDPSKGETPETLARQRAILDAMLQNSQGVPQSLGEGIASIGQALSARLGYAALAKKEAAAKAAGDAAFGSIAGAMAGKSAFPPAPGYSSASASSAAPDYHGDQLAWTDAAPYQKALLNTIAGPESGGKYNVIYGGGTFDDFSHHPNQAVRIQTGPNAGRTSSAAGKYQFLGSTWDDQAKKLGLTDFSPVNQDKAAWNLAAETYKAKTGNDLATVLQSGDPQAIAGVGPALAGQWTSLPGGIEQGTNVNRFVATYQRALGAGATPAQATAVAQQTTQPKPVQVASLDPSAGVSSIDPYGRIPATDSRGEDQRAKFRHWNSNPVANEAANEAAIDPALAGVVDRAKQIAGTNFVIGSGRRDAGMQQKAVDWGWSKTNDSDHLGGGAVDLWPVDANGQVVFDPQKQAQIVQAMKQAAKEKGVDLDPGADWSRFKDVPHFGMVGQTPLDNAPIPTPRPGNGGGVQVASLDPSAGVTGYAPGAPGATTPAGQRVLAAMMSKQPMGGPVASLQPSAGATPDAAPSAIPVPAAPAQQRIVQAMQSNLPVMAGGDAGAIQWDQNGGPSMQTLMQAANSAPYMNDAQRSILSAIIQNKMQDDDPLRQLQIQAARKSLAAPPKQWQKLDDHTLFDPASGETKAATGGARPLFDGTSIEGQAWNILQTADPGSREYATAYSIVSQPKTQLVQTENGLVPVQVPPQLPSWLKTPTGEGVPAPPVSPAPAAPAGATPAPGPAPASPNGVKSGAAIPGTTKPPNEAQQRNRQLYAVVQPELATIEQNFSALSDPNNQAWSHLPIGAEYMTSPEFQRAQNSINTIIASYLYSVSGATASPAEVEKQAAVLTPKLGESKQSIDDKLARIRTMVDAIKNNRGDNADEPSGDVGGEWQDMGNGVKIRMKP